MMGKAVLKVVLLVVCLMCAGSLAGFPVQAAEEQPKILVMGAGGTESWLRENASNETYEALLGRPKPGQGHAIRYSEAYKRADISAPELLEAESLINTERERAGVAPLTWKEDLMRLAAVKAGLNVQCQGKWGTADATATQDIFWEGFDLPDNRHRLHVVDIEWADTPATFMEWCQTQPRDWAELMSADNIEAGIAHIDATQDSAGRHYWVVLLQS